MSPYDNRSIVDETNRKEAAASAQIDVADLVGIVRRGWFYIVAGTLIGIGAAVAALSAMPPFYTANTRIVFERTVAKYMQTNRIIDGPSIDDADIWGQIYIVSSDSNILPVVRSLGLADDPEFNGAKDETSLKERVRDLVRETVHSIRGVEPPAAVAGDPEKIALNSVLRGLTVTRGDVPNLISVSFSSKDPAKAARIANAIVESYQAASIATKVNSTNTVSRMVQDRVTELKQQAADAERAVLEYKMAHNLVGSGGDALTGDQLTSLQSHLTTARVAMAEAKARVDRTGAGGDLDGPFAPDNELISRLRTQYLELASRASDIESRVGQGHLAVVKMRSRMAEVRGAIADEQKRLAGSFTREYELARARYDELAATVSQVLTEKGSNSGVQARIKELDSAAETLRTLYNRMLERATDANRMADERPASITPDARVVTHATPPAQTDASKKRFLILAGGSFLGFLLGCVVVLARNFPFGVFRTAQQVSRATGLACAVLPRVVRRSDQAALRVGEYALDTPYSRFTETLRSIWALINIAQRETGAKVICVVSSVPGEGKTTVATNLASHFSRHTSARVLLIDADFHRHSLTDRVTPQASAGLKEALDEPAEFAKYVVRKERLQLDVLPCPQLSRIPNAAELLGTPAMQKLIDTAREVYDLVVIEAPPMAAVVDFKMISRHCDAFIFVVEWSKTSQRLVLECLGDVSGLLDRVLCVVLNKFDPRALKSVERYKGDRFQDYYSDRKAA